jgi:hypothetical protein
MIPVVYCQNKGDKTELGLLSIITAVVSKTTCLFPLEASTINILLKCLLISLLWH